MSENINDSTVWLPSLTSEANLDVQFRDDHVHVQLGPGYTLTPEQQNEFWEKLSAICEEHGSKRVLVEGYVPTGERDTMGVVEAGKRTAIIPHLWLAIRLKDYVPNERSELFTVIAGGHGVRAKFFADTDRALTWLRSNAPA